ncbi:MAG: TlpA family protein disulfide reductase, partial [Candidatus Eremiobacteraeota bacterium]|nr:TlpA family protein disulfide reductase [Candidatus Eremiobacteraeota bacterium]
IWYGTHPQQQSQVQTAANVASSSKTPPPIKLAVGMKAPEFAASTTAGPFDLAKATKSVFLEVFATWCPHCQRETQVLDKLFALYGKRITFVAVSGSDLGMDGSKPASQQDVLDFAQRFQVKYPIAYDGQETVMGLYDQGGYPTMLIIGKDKTIKYATSGEMAYADLAAQIEKVVK